MFKEEKEELLFNWSMIGDVQKGRPNLGSQTDVGVYRLMQFTLRDTLIREFGHEKADNLFYQAGKNAGIAFCRKLLPEKVDFNQFIGALQEQLKNLKIGILRMEKADMETLHFTLTVAEDLDCSGLPLCNETICTYDEGFISGLFFAYTGRAFTVREVDCWCSGDRVCRFDVSPAE